LDTHLPYDHDARSHKPQILLYVRPIRKLLSIYIFWTHTIEKNVRLLI
jgi:hypothetical protein